MWAGMYHIIYADNKKAMDPLPSLEECRKMGKWGNKLDNSSSFEEEEELGKP